MGSICCSAPQKCGVCQIVDQRGGANGCEGGNIVAQEGAGKDGEFLCLAAVQRSAGSHESRDR